jgi:type VI secretion system protein ImpF
MLQDTLQSPFLQLTQDMKPDQEADNHSPPVLLYRQYKESVMHDIENLLNNRCRGYQQTSTLEGDMLLTYGVTDFAQINISALSGRESLRLKIQDAIRVNEPRLMDVRVCLNEKQEDPDRLGFRIEAKLMFFDDSEPVVITALFEPALKTFNFNSVLR